MYAVPAWVVDALLEQTSAGIVSPAALLVLLAVFVEDAREDLRATIEGALALALERVDAERDARERCEWMAALAEAAAVSEDDRIARAVQAGLPAALEDLERMVSARYEPGEGLMDEAAGGQILGGMALLSAFEMTGRLPYAMLSEELLQVASRRWTGPAGAFDADFRTNCRAAQLLCRLALLRRDPDYAAAAVVAREADYGAAAGRVMAWLAPRALDHPADADEYGVALHRWFAFNQLPN